MVVLSEVPASKTDQVLIDLIHAVAKIPEGSGHSSVIYVPSVPLCEGNLKNLAGLRDSFLRPVPGPDMLNIDPPVEGYKNTADYGFLKSLGPDAMRMMGFEQFPEEGKGKGEIRMKQKANKHLFELAPVVTPTSA